MKKIIIYLVLLIPITSNAQDYLHAVGFRSGLGNSLQYKFNTTDENGYELGVGTRFDGLQITALSIFHQQAGFGSNGRFFWMYGFGGHTGYQKAWKCQNCIHNDSLFIPPHFKQKKVNFFALGVDLYVGLEYRFEVIPATISLDWKPYVGLFGPSSVSRRFDDFGINIKYIIE